jgi:hypothetical protein
MAVDASICFDVTAESDEEAVKKAREVVDKADGRASDWIDDSCTYIGDSSTVTIEDCEEEQDSVRHRR